jgi:NAD(P)-dependent dehydrogenase (short-subunit alcohol dehydrogenase family)
VNDEDIERCARVLAAIAEDRGLLAKIDPGLRRELLTAAGRLAHPTRSDEVRLKKALRRKDREEQKAHDAAILERTGMRVATAAPVFPSPEPEPGREEAASVGELREPRACYVCKADFTRVHHYYPSMCPPCAALNYGKRTQSAPLPGRVALVTGGRVKIGYHTVLKLVRAGATVIVTTRFPHDAAMRYGREPDFEVWKDRLRVHGLDLRHAPSVELFAEHLAATLPRLDVLINNAAQTVRRPAAFYQHLLAGEEAPLSALPPHVRPLLAAHDALCTSTDPRRNLLPPARATQLPLTADDLLDSSLFPIGRYDGDLQQIDLRRMNSWRLGAADVPTPELLEVHLVNAIAPFLLVSRLKPLMTRDRTDEKHVINVSAMEAQFARKKKTDKHPHTNMAKAALNMLTRTSAADYANDGIWMNSVDTGWVTDEDPVHHVARKQEVHEFWPPLDVIDGAARILDPLFVGLATGRHPFGLFFKDYHPVDW